MAALREPVTVTAKVPSRVPGSKRSIDFQRKYATAIKAIEQGEILPAVKPVMSRVNCSPRTASAVLAKAVDSDSRFSRDTRGRVSFNGGQQ